MLIKMSAIEHTHGEVQGTLVILLDGWPSPGGPHLPGYITSATHTHVNTHTCLHQIHTHTYTYVTYTDTRFMYTCTRHNPASAHTHANYLIHKHVQTALSYLSKALGKNPCL